MSPKTSTPTPKILRVGTRRSTLARAQTQWVVERLQQWHPELRIEIHDVVTTGDRLHDASLYNMAGKGVFVKEIEEQLLAGEIDLAVHSMKDLPTELPDGLTIGAVSERVDPRDVLVTRHGRLLNELPSGSRIGTSSLRRKVQLLNFSAALEVVDIRGNIDTRLKKSESTDYDGIILAAAGLHRMGWLDRVQAYLSCEQMVPAVGQGALGLEVRADDTLTRKRIEPLNDPEAAAAVSAERIFLQAMGGGCQTPMAAFCRVRDGRVVFHAFASREDGSKASRQSLEGTLAEAEDMARALAATLRARLR